MSLHKQLGIAKINRQQFRRRSVNFFWTNLRDFATVEAKQQPKLAQRSARDMLKNTQEFRTTAFFPEVLPGVTALHVTHGSNRH